MTQIKACILPNTHGELDAEGNIYDFDIVEKEIIKKIDEGTLFLKNGDYDDYDHVSGVKLKNVFGIASSYSKDDDGITVTFESLNDERNIEFFDYFAGVVKKGSFVLRSRGFGKVDDVGRVYDYELVSFSPSPIENDSFRIAEKNEVEFDDFKGVLNEF